VIEKFGIAPEQIVDYLALMGDKVDNIPGVDKCGPKTAVKWLQEYGTLQNVMSNAEKISGKIGENLRAACEFLPLSQLLATIKTDVELPMNWQDLQASEPDRAALLALFTELEFKSWIAEINNGGDVIAAVTDCNTNHRKNHRALRHHHRNFTTASVDSAPANCAVFCTRHRNRLARLHAGQYCRPVICRRSGTSGVCARGARLSRRTRTTLA
jgi:hypothetical protein